MRGIGRWTAEMFLIFNQLRPDVFRSMISACNGQFLGNILKVKTEPEDRLPNLGTLAPLAFGSNLLSLA